MKQKSKAPKDPLAALREQLAVFLQRWKDRGGRVTSWECRACGSSNDTRRPPTKHVVQTKGYWDSVMRCCWCGELSFVKVWPNGTTKAEELPA